MVNKTDFVKRVRDAMLSDPEGGFGTVITEMYLEKIKPYLTLINQASPDLSVKLIEDLGPLLSTALNSIALLGHRKDVKDSIIRVQIVKSQILFSKYIALIQAGFKEEQAFALLLAETGQPSMAAKYLDRAGDAVKDVNRGKED